MFAAPLLVGLELVNRAIDLAAVLAVFCRLAINFGAICLDTPMAIFFKIMVVVGESHLGRRKHEGHSQCQSQSDSSDFRFHGCSSYVRDLAGPPGYAEHPKAFASNYLYAEIPTTMRGLL